MWQLPDRRLSRVRRFEPRSATQAARAGRRGERELTTDLQEHRSIEVDQFYGIDCEGVPGTHRPGRYVPSRPPGERRTRRGVWPVVPQLPHRRAPLTSSGQRATYGLAQAAAHQGVLLLVRQSTLSRHGLDERQATRGQPLGVRRRRDQGAANGATRLRRLLDAKALDYLAGSDARAAFVSTNSLTQGEQARTMEPLLARSGFEIDFAHQTFPWTSEARGRCARARGHHRLLEDRPRKDPSPVRVSGRQG